MLSHPERLILLKAVLSSLLVYYMTVTMISKTTTNRLSSLLCKFMWGEVNKDRYLTEGEQRPVPNTSGLEQGM
jgi:hypothetical protein